MNISKRWQRDDYIVWVLLQQTCILLYVYKIREQGNTHIKTDA